MRLLVLEPLPKSLFETYSSGKCIYLAAALSRRHGLDIQAVLSDNGPSCVVHAWVTDEERLMCWDADGCYPSNLNGWTRSGKDVLTLASESELFELASLTGCTIDEWNKSVAEALAVVDQHYGHKKHKSVEDEVSL